VESSTVDGIHLESESHRALGSAVARLIESQFPDGSTRRSNSISGKVTTSSGLKLESRLAADTLRQSGEQRRKGKAGRIGVRPNKGGHEK
ncbi:MAG: hypothetical protein J0H08_12355, partial [Rhizobiales bacterium]|nr:hypothetical protein [Hyphomicrobiales bacterium]